MADHSKPTNTSLYTDYTTELDARFDDLAVGLDPAVTTATNIPTNTIRWNSVNSYWEKYNGSTWAALDTGYEIDLAGARKITTNSASPALTITQTGSGNAFVVEDSASTDSTPFVIDASGIVIQGHTQSVISGYSYQCNSANPFAGIRWNSANAGGVTSLLGRSRSGTVGTNTIVQVNDALGNLVFAGDDGSSFILGASITAAVDGTPGTNDMPGRLVFSTTADGASSPTERMRIDNAGRIAIGGATGTEIDVFLRGNSTGNVNKSGISNRQTILSDVTGYFNSFSSFPVTQGASFTLANLRHFDASQQTFGAGSTVTNQFGYLVNNNLTGATNNYGFYSNIPSGTGRWNFFANGTADNAFAGNTRFGGTTAPTVAVDVTGAVKATGNIAGGYVAHAAGTTAMAFGSYNVVRVTPNATATYTTTVPAAGSIVVLSILTSGTTSYTITFGTGFKSTGTLATGTTSARYFNLTFVSDGTNLIETARTVAIA